MPRKLPAWLKNKYVIATIAFAVWIIFFDRNDLITQAGYMSHLHELKDKKEYLQQQIAQTDKNLHELLSNPQKLEKFAREKYLMKKSNEDVYVIEGSGPDEKKK
jgi:cell division protein FtsB